MAGYGCGRAVLMMLIVAALCGCSPRNEAAPPAAASDPARGGLARQAMVAAANPLAVDAGVRVLQAGGSAIDAAVAVQAVLGLVEPQSSGLGGGAFLLYYDARTHQVTAYDGRETAPAAAGPDLFTEADGKPLGFATAVLSGRSTGAPGAIAMLALAQREHGALPWNGLFADARALAIDGFTVTPRLAGMIASAAPQAAAPDAVAYFTGPDGHRLKAGDRLRNPAYAASLDRIAQDGAAGLLGGPLAQAIVARIAAGPLPGALSLADLRGYQPHEGPALCRPYRVYLVCTPSAPSGGVGLQIALGILAHTDIGRRDAGDPAAWLEFAEASRLAYADRDRYVADPAFVAVPLAGLLDNTYLANRARSIGTVAGPPPSFGRPAGARLPGVDATAEPGGTSHYVIVDRAGNVVSITTTVESVFGSGRMVGGFFLNNQLTDFSFAPTAADGTPAANAVGPGKRPRSTMAPIIVLDRDGRFVAALGSPGGSSIQAYNLKALVALLDWKMAPQAAIDLPNLIARGASFTGEPFPAPLAEQLRARGIVVSPTPAETSGLHIILKHKEGYEGAADRRREGVARGY